jgi:phospholipid N-methyltransferase
MGHLSQLNPTLRGTMKPKKGQTWTGKISGLPMRVLDVSDTEVLLEVERRIPVKGSEPTIVTRQVTIPRDQFSNWANAYTLEKT